jgi:hypothetical protein
MLCPKEVGTANRGFIKAGNFFSSSVTVGFSRRIQLHLHGILLQQANYLSVT